MKLTMIKALYKKEIMDILRDRKTILMMIAVPLIIYPLIFMVSLFLASSMLNESTSRTFPIAFMDFDNSVEVQDYFVSKGKELDYSFLFKEADHPEEMLLSGSIKAYVDMTVSDNNIPYYSIYYNASDNTSQTVASMVQDLFMEYNNTIRTKLLTDEGYDADYMLHPIRYDVMNIASNEKTVGNIFGLIVPYLLISSVLMGAMYPAIDVTSGEKERGTLETLLTLPVRNIDMILSKFFATSTIAVGTAFLNVFSMGIIGFYMYSVVEATNSNDAGFNVSLYIPSILLTLVVAVIFAMLSSAVCLSVCIFARSFKEAQNYTTPIMLVFMFCGMAAMVPGFELNAKTALMPVINFALLISNIFKFEYDFSLIMRVIIINLAYSMLAILFMTKVFSSENILFGDGTNGIKIIEKRSEMKDKSIPGIGDVILLFSVLLIVLFMVGSLLIVKHGLMGSNLQQLIILLLTVLYCIYIKTDFKKVFWLKKPKFVSIIAGIIIWLGGYLFINVGSDIYAGLFPSKAENVNSMYVTILGDNPGILIFLSIALVPAICEEIAFRGMLFGTLANRGRIWPAIIISGFMFGAYHMTLVQFIFVGFLGCVMAYVVYKSGSIIVSMIMHFCNNAVGAILMIYPDKIGELIPFLANEKLTIGQSIGYGSAGIVIMILGILLLNKTSKVKNESTQGNL